MGLVGVKKAKRVVMAGVNLWWESVGGWGTGEGSGDLGRAVRTLRDLCTSWSRL